MVPEVHGTPPDADQAVDELREQVDRHHAEDDDEERHEADRRGGILVGEHVLLELPRRADHERQQGEGDGAPERATHETAEEHADRALAVAELARIFDAHLVPIPAVTRPRGMRILVTEQEGMRGGTRDTERNAVREIALPDRDRSRRKVGEPAVVTQEPAHPEPAAARGAPRRRVAHPSQALDRRKREELRERGEVEPVPPALPATATRVRDPFAEMGDAEREREQTEYERDAAGEDRPVGAVPAVTGEAAVARVALDRLGKALPPPRRLLRRTDLECFDRCRAAGRAVPDEVEHLAFVFGDGGVIVLRSQSHDEVVGRDLVDADHAARGQVDERRADREPAHLEAIDQEVRNRGRLGPEVARLRPRRPELGNAGRPANRKDHEP